MGAGAGSEGSAADLSRMVEYIDRYDGFAAWLSEKGWYVTGNDHLGHGKSVLSEENYGFFHEPDGNRCVTGDIQKLRERTEQRYPGVPYFMLGHSMVRFFCASIFFHMEEGFQEPLSWEPVTRAICCCLPDSCCAGLLRW